MASITSSVSPNNAPSVAAAGQRDRSGALGTLHDPNSSAGSDLSGSSVRNLAELSPEQKQQVAKLAQRDREVRAHEAAHANVGGVYAGAPSYQYQRGPDGQNYAVGGEVSIDTSPVPGDPQATIAKAQVVRRAALAPAQPSLQDRAVASEALAMEQQARRELLENTNGLGAALRPGSLVDTIA